MVKTLATNGSNDIYLGDQKNIVVLSGLNAIIAACETASKAQLGEMVFATQTGIPNFQAVWVGTPNYPLFTAYLREQILGVEGVQEVTDIQLRAQNNVLSYTATIKTVFGNGVISD